MSFHGNLDPYISSVYGGLRCLMDLNGSRLYMYVCGVIRIPPDLLCIWKDRWRDWWWIPSLLSSFRVVIVCLLWLSPQYKLPPCLHMLSDKGYVSDVLSVTLAFAHLLFFSTSYLLLTPSLLFHPFRCFSLRVCPCLRAVGRFACSSLSWRRREASWRWRRRRSRRWWCWGKALSR